MRIGQEAKDFMYACEAIHVLLDQGPLTPDEHRAIELTGIALLSKLMPPEHSRVIHSGAA